MGEAIISRAGMSNPDSPKLEWIPITEIITENKTWVAPGNIRNQQIEVRLFGGGGGREAINGRYLGNKGGSGGYMNNGVLTVADGQQISITIGAGGIPNNPGATSSFGSYFSSNGGSSNGSGGSGGGGAETLISGNAQQFGGGGGSGAFRYYKATVNHGSSYGGNGGLWGGGGGGGGGLNWSLESWGGESGGKGGIYGGNGGIGLNWILHSNINIANGIDGTNTIKIESEFNGYGLGGKYGNSDFYSNGRWNSYGGGGGGGGYGGGGGGGGDAVMNTTNGDEFWYAGGGGGGGGYGGNGGSARNAKIYAGINFCWGGGGGGYGGKGGDAVQLSGGGGGGYGISNYGCGGGGTSISGVNGKQGICIIKYYQLGFV